MPPGTNSVGVAHDAGQPIGKLAVGIDRTREIEIALNALAVAEHRLHLVERLAGRRLALQVDQSAGRAETVEGRARPAHHGDAVNAIRLGLEHAETGADEAQAVEIDAVIGDVEAADRDGVEARIVAGGIDADARLIADRFRQRLHGAVVELLAGHDRDRLRRLEQRGVRLRACRAAACDIAVLARRVGAAAARLARIRVSGLSGPGIARDCDAAPLRL
ncbi:hypothetical protein ABIF83_006152 [Bradyrhizobium ottawaense]